MISARGWACSKSRTFFAAAARIRCAAPSSSAQTVSCSCSAPSSSTSSAAAKPRSAYSSTSTWRKRSATRVRTCGRSRRSATARSTSSPASSAPTSASSRSWSRYSCANSTSRAARARSASSPSGSASRPRGVVGGRHEAVLQAVDAIDDVGQQHGGPPADVVAAQVQVVHPVQQQREPVGARDRREERVDARLGGLLAQQPRAELAHGVDRELLVGAVERVLDGAPQRGGAGRRRGQHEDRLGRGVLVRDEPGEAPGEHGRLAAARPAEHEQRPAGMGDRALLV